MIFVVSNKAMATAQKRIRINKNVIFVFQLIHFSKTKEI